MMSYIRLQCLNSRRTIITLPVEILCQIFLFASQPLIYNSRKTNIIVSHVCHQWRKVAIDFAQLWSTLTISCNSKNEWQRLREYHRRSKQAPLFLVAPSHWEMADKTLYSHPLFRALIELSLPKLQYLQGDPSLVKYMTSAAPILHTLILTSGFIDEESNTRQFISDDVFGGCSTSLRVLRLDFVDVRWSSPLLRNLTVLSLRSTRIDCSHGFGLFECLTLMPNLEKLELCRNEFANTEIGDLQIQHFPKVDLPRLEYLCVFEDIETLAFFLDHLNLPRPLQVKFNAEVDRQDQQPLLLAVMALVNDLYRHPGAKAESFPADVELDEFGYHHFQYDSHYSIDICIRFQETLPLRLASSLLESLHDYIPLGSFDCVTVISDLDPWMKTYSKMENIKVLVMDNPYSPLDVLHALVKDLHHCPNGCPDSFTPGIFLPKLRTLRIEDIELSLFWDNPHPFKGYTFMEALCLCLEKRHLAGVGIETLFVISDQDIDEEILKRLPDFVTGEIYINDLPLQYA